LVAGKRKDELVSDAILITDLQRIAADFDYDHDVPDPTEVISELFGKPDQRHALNTRRTGPSPFFTLHRTRRLRLRRRLLRDPAPTPIAPGAPVRRREKTLGPALAGRLGRNRLECLRFS
jgi:hypothetical protein